MANFMNNYPQTVLTDSVLPSDGVVCGISIPPWPSVYIGEYLDEVTIIG